MKLEQKAVSAISGHFVIPSYQRGYRWGRPEVKCLLDDIEASTGSYCLQPIVVKPLDDNRYELIDGQQRLTTLYLILKVIRTYKPRLKETYTIEYQTREASKDFLDNIEQEKSKDNIDFYYIYQAFDTIEKWFEEKDDPDWTVDQLYGKLVRDVKVLWYTDDSEEAGQDMFARLNHGRLHLTDAELVKALILSQTASHISEDTDKLLKATISNQWDIVETALRDDALWAFLTNDKPDDYPARIDLLMKFVARTKDKLDEADEHAVFNSFARRAKKESLVDIWDEIYKCFLELKGWARNTQLYHRAGFLVAISPKKSKTSALDIISNERGKGKTERLLHLEERITEKLPKEQDLDALSYESTYKTLLDLLLWMNVKTTELAGGRFPFDSYKEENWSIEHIHAQHSQKFNTSEQWRAWLDDSRIALCATKTPEALHLADEISMIVKKKITESVFEEISKKVFDLLSSSGQNKMIGDMHSFDNLALLSTSDNAALNNSLFAPKRMKIIELDKAGKYIPPCTRNIFLKYYSPEDSQQPLIWGEADRKAYRKAIIKTVYNH